MGRSRGVAVLYARVVLSWNEVWKEMCLGDGSGNVVYRQAVLFFKTILVIQFRTCIIMFDMKF